MAGRKSMAEEWLEPEKLLMIEGWARDKITNKDMAAKCIGIGERTFAEWIIRYPAIAAALKKGRAPVAEKIEKSLYDLCEVQEYTDTVIEEYQDAEGNVTGRHIRKTKRQMPPNTTAIIFALKNLKPEKWREKQNITINNGNELPQLYKALEAEEADDDVREANTEAEENI